MADMPVTVRLVTNIDGFTGRLRVADEAARLMNAAWQLSQATWEPHDWSTF